MLPGCEASHMHFCHPDCLHGWLTRLRPIVFTTITSLHGYLSIVALIKCLHRHATCPVCRQRLGAEEDEGSDGGAMIG